MIEVAYVICWWLALEIIGLVSFPLVSRVCSNLGDRGYSISKLVGLLLLTYIVWMVSSIHLLPFGIGSILISFLLLAGLSLYLGRKNLKIANWPWRQIIISELVFGVSFVIFLLIVRGGPDIYFGGACDAFFNSAFLHSTLRSDYFPPMDPWFAGESIPYYYGGHLMVATLTKATAVPSTISFNIAGAAFHALAMCASYGLGYNITRRKLYGLLTAVFVCIAGFASGAFQLAAYFLEDSVLGFVYWGEPGITDWLSGFHIGAAPWLVEGIIIHYPYHSFIMGDLHSYMISPPFQVMYITLIFALFQRGRLSGKIARSDTLLDIFILGLCLGFFMLLNSWEYPTYIIFTLLAFILLRIRTGIKYSLAIPAAIARSLTFFLQKITRRENSIKDNLAIPVAVIAVPVAIIGLSFILFIPYYVMGWTSGYHGLGWVPASIRTSLVEILEFCPLFLFAAFSLLFVLSKRKTFICVLFIPVLFSLLFVFPDIKSLERIVFIVALSLLPIFLLLVVLSERETFRGMRVILATIFILGATILAAILLDFQLIVIAVPIGLLSLYYICRGKPRSEKEFVFLLLFIGAALIFFCDFIYIKDASPVRFNTVMKVYLQLWVFLAISAACAVFYVLNKLGRKRRVIWVIILAAFTLACLINPIASTITMAWGKDLHVNWGSNRGTLDGMAYIEMLDKGDYEAIKWLNKEIKGSPVILEAPGNPYSYSARISTFTGLPTVVGWRWWEAAWRHVGWPNEVWDRAKDVAMIYDTSDNKKALELLKKYDVEYVYIGTVERETYASGGLQKFASQTEDYELVYDEENVTIYRVIDETH